MYRGEYFAIQCDAHVDFIKHWDTTIIDAWKSANNEMAVMTTYLSDVHGAMDDEGNLKTFSRPIMCKRCVMRIVIKSSFLKLFVINVFPISLSLSVEKRL